MRDKVFGVAAVSHVSVGTHTYKRDTLEHWKYPEAAFTLNPELFLRCVKGTGGVEIFNTLALPP